MFGADDDCTVVQALEHGGDFGHFFGRHQVGFVQNNHIRKLYLIGQKVYNRAMVTFAGLYVAVSYGMAAAKIMGEVERIHYRHHRIDVGPTRKVDAIFFIHKTEGLGHRYGFRNPCAFNQQVIKTFFFGQAFYLQHQVFAQGATDAAIAHFHQFFFGAGKGLFFLDQTGIDVDLTHVVDNHGHF